MFSFRSLSLSSNIFYAWQCEPLFHLDDGRGRQERCLINSQLSPVRCQPSLSKSSLSFLFSVRVQYEIIFIFNSFSLSFISSGVQR